MGFSFEKKAPRLMRRVCMAHLIGQTYPRGSGAAIFLMTAKALGPHTFASLPLLSFFFLVKPRPLQRCVSMLQTESLRKQRFQTFLLAYEKFGESASLFGSSICALGRPMGRELCR